MNGLRKESTWMLKKIVAIFMIAAFATILCGCGTKEEKKSKHLANAQKYEEQQEYSKAAI